jgi:hypothetical protein
LENKSFITENNVSTEKKGDVQEEGEIVKLLAVNEELRA